MKIQIFTYQPDKDTRVTVRGELEDRTIWATQRQIAEALKLDVRTVSHHVQNFKEQRGERANASIQKFRIVAEDGKTRDVEHYNMTIITYVGFRAQATERVIDFQDWAGQQLENALIMIAPQTPTTLEEMFVLQAQINLEHSKRLAQIEAENTHLHYRQRLIEAKLDTIKRDLPVRYDKLADEAIENKEERRKNRGVS